jgi:hypothetical protein
MMENKRSSARATVRGWDILSQSFLNLPICPNSLRGQFPYFRDMTLGKQAAAVLLPNPLKGRPERFRWQGRTPCRGIVLSRLARERQANARLVGKNWRRGILRTKNGRAPCFFFDFLPYNLRAAPFMVACVKTIDTRAELCALAQARGVTGKRPMAIQIAPHLSSAGYPTHETTLRR